MKRPSVSVVAEPIDAAEVLARVGGPSDGAVLLFLGTVRDHADGRPVGGLHYEAYQAMAEDVLAAIAGEAAERSAPTASRWCTASASSRSAT
jgi:molybdopterin synthase catalytic subunit